MSDDIMYAADEAFGHTDQEKIKQAKIARLTPKQKLVFDAIKENPEAANDDALLLSIVWLKEGWIFWLKEGWYEGSDLHSILYDNLKHVSRPETLSRRRRELFNLGLITYSPKALKTRETAFKNEKDKASPIPPQVKSKFAKRVESLTPLYDDAVNKSFDNQGKLQKILGLPDTFEEDRKSYFNQEHLFNVPPESKRKYDQL